MTDPERQDPGSPSPSSPPARASRLTGPRHRVRLLIQYDGAAFLGWQRQGDAPTVQKAMEDALAELLGRPATVMVAGRTDAGVHAMAMPAHFDTDHPIPGDKVAIAVGPLLPHAISVLESSEAPDGWDARRSARLRWYRYQILLERRGRPLGPRAWRVHRKLDFGAIERALELLRGSHDFSGFRSSQCQAKRTVLDLQQATMTRAGDLLAFDFKCRSFLHHMIRFLAGTLVSVGQSQMSLDRMLEILEHGERPRLILCAPPHGLCLMQVGYSPEDCAAILAAAPAPPSF